VIRILVAALLLSAAAFGQSDRGTITGTISDPAGAVVAGATIEARNVDTGSVFPVASSGTGNYTIPNLPAGTYELAVTVPGFKRFVRTGLAVQVAATMRVDAALEVGAATESVTVSEAAPLLKTEGGEVASNIATKTLNDLPILTLSGAAAGFGSANSLGNIRNPLASVNLLPGARITADSIMRINGMPSNSQAINIEGQDATNGFIKQQNQINQSGVEAIQEVAIQTSNFAAEYGAAGGGFFNYTMKSGTNQFHGSVYDYFVNEALNAGLPFTDAASISPSKAGKHIRNSLRQNDYGFTIGGPISIPGLYDGHDKTFFFFNFEQFRQGVTVGNTQSIVPTLAQRVGDFSAAVNYNNCSNTANAANLDPLGQPVCFNQIFDPLTQREVGGSQVRLPFAGNIIPESRIDSTAKIIQNMIPLPNGTGLINYTAPGYRNFRHTTIPSIKIDHNLSSRIKLSGYYSATKTISPQANGFTQPFSALQPQNNLSHTLRLNLDTSLTPTVLFHLGAGLLYTSQPQPGVAPFDQKQLYNQGGVPFSSSWFPYIAGMSSAIGGGWSGGGAYPTVTNTGVAFTLSPEQYDIKPTFNTNLTWVKGNHTYKMGATALFEGIVNTNNSRAQGQFNFSQIQTANPWQNGQPFANTASSGFGYASFFLGGTNTTATAAPARLRLGTHSFALYVQDTWKVTRKLTLDYGLRYDRASLWREQYGRLQNAVFDQPNPLLGGRLGTVSYEAVCKCQFAPDYKFAFGPRLGGAYQIDSKTVFRAGFGISYAPIADQANLATSASDFYTIPSAAYGAASSFMRDGDPLGPGNRFGNPVVKWPNFAPSYPVPAAPGIIPPASPFVSIAPNAARLPRTAQWSIGFQRQITENTVVEAAYVGNRGAWWTSPLLSSINYNALRPEDMRRFGIDLSNPTDTTLLSTQINSPAVLARFPHLRDPNSVYPGFPATQTLLQTLRPYAQWIGIPPFLGPPMGNTWYDSLQVKASKRLTHGLSAQMAYTWQKELTNGTNSNTSYVTPSPPLINDVFNKGLNKQISGFSLPQSVVISFNYQTPRINADAAGLRALSWVARDWTIGGVLRYQSGQILQTPNSTGNLLANLGRGPTNNPALWGGGYTFKNRVAGQPLFTIDPNASFDPTSKLVLNPNAWTEPAPGTFGASPAYFNDYRWKRQPSESLAFGRTFAYKERLKFSVRAEFQNILNRTTYSIPATAGATTTTSPTGRANSLSGTTGLLSAGWGYVNWVQGAGTTPRSGQIVARVTF
jgi:Carboxypeptidase regulatory-like domain/TonB dependent receptor